ncbi:putative immunoglobulin-blocking virulence protein [Mycoplasmopsis alligatoris]|uniref:Membrane family protein n=1 Tax=Mycoplasmopsis alligatoris A21JP2 TaxID=747682 RepID=D4XV42_9BACT|nr:putative immunoglobulin-blocking virulence protein [Mycoplasmopsis alligatoris]EFF41782.1 membrane family protein [Mycoplasmopsis alligatoris A21JP2]
MIKAKKKKIIIVSSIAGGALIIPHAIAVPIYLKNANQQNVDVDIKFRSPSSAIINNAIGIDPLRVSNADNNLELTKPESAKPVIKPEEPKPKPEPKPEPVDTTPTEPSPEKPTESVKPGPDKKDQEGDGRIIVDAETELTINLPGSETLSFPVKLKHKIAAPRHKFPASDNDIINRVPYVNNDSPEVVELTVTDELKKAVAKPVREFLKTMLAFKEEAWRNESGKDLKDIDLTKLELSENALAMLKKGLILDYTNAFITKDGKLDSRGYSVVNETYNGTTGRMARDNARRRHFGYKSWYVRSPQDIADGTFAGWEKTDVKSEWKEFGLTEDDGIQVTKYTNNDPEFAKSNNSIRVVLDAANPKGYQKFLDFLTKTKKAGRKIQSFVIKNMGSKDQNQSFLSIIKALPDEIPQLELWFESNNTGAMIGLRGKKIDEFATYTTGNSLVDQWGLNPWAVDGVAYFQDVDYNVSKDYPPGFRPSTRITWNALAFDPENYKPKDPDPWKDINRGLRMALVVRNNEPIFQGGFGPGLNPDNNEKGNSYPVGLDISRIPELRSLKGFDYSPLGADGKPIVRKLRRITLYSDTDSYTLSADEMNKSQYHKIMFLDEPRDEEEVRLRFNGGPTVKHMYLNGNDVLTEEGLKNMETFYRQVGWKVFKEQFKSKVFVDKTNKKLYNQLKERGYPVEFRSEDSTLKLN